MQVRCYDSQNIFPNPVIQFNFRRVTWITRLSQLPVTANHRSVLVGFVFTVCHWDRFISENVIFPLSVSSNQYPISIPSFIHLSQTLYLISAIEFGF